MGCVHSSEIIKLNDNHEEKTDNNQRNNISNSINNSCIKDKYKKSPNEEMTVTKNSNKIIQNENQKNENEINENEINENEINENEEIEKKESKKYLIIIKMINLIK